MPALQAAGKWGARGGVAGRRTRKGGNGAREQVFWYVKCCGKAVCAVCAEWRAFYQRMPAAGEGVRKAGGEGVGQGEGR